MKSDDTTIKLSRKTKERLDMLKEYHKESYEEVLKKMLYTLNVFSKNPLAGNKILRNIEITKKRHEMLNKNENIQEKNFRIRVNNSEIIDSERPLQKKARIAQQKN